MERWGARHLFVFSLLALFPLTSTAASSFSECYPDSKLPKFWEREGFAISNPYVTNVFGVAFYSYAFDAKINELQFPDVSLAGEQYLMSHKLQLSDYPGAKTGLLAVSDSLSQSASYSREAHRLSQSAQDKTLLLLGAASGLLLPMPVTPAVQTAAGLWKTLEMINYISNYPGKVARALGSSADAYLHAEAAAHAVAASADEEYLFLQKAGAGSEKYSGDAKDAFFSAHEYLSPAGRCTADAESSLGIFSYFDDLSGQPGLPDLGSIGFGEHLQRLAGEDENASIFQLARQHSALKAGHEAMESEYARAIKAAEGAQGVLQTLLGGLGAEQLSLIGDVPFAQGTGTVSVGATYSGIYSGYTQLHDKGMPDADSLLTQARETDETEQDYLANAILLAMTSKDAYDVAIASSRMVRTSAEAAVAAQGTAAERKIAEAKEKANRPASTFANMAAQQLAQKKLADAEQAFLDAPYQQTLGMKYKYYSDALKAAADSIAAAENTYAASLVQTLNEAFRSQHAFLSDAHLDGADTVHEEEMLAEYEKLLSASSSPENLGPVLGLLQKDRAAVLDRLKVKYSGLDARYAGIKALVSQVRSQDGSFLSPQFESLSQDFPGGMLSVEAAVGRLSGISGKLDGFAADVQARAPSYLTFLLSKNARVFQLAQTPALGKETAYEATITTENPSPLSYGSAIPFSAAADAQLYSSDFTSGDGIDDVYPEKGKTTIVLPSVAAGAHLSFNFKKMDAPAQITSSAAQCAQATAAEAQVKEQLEFFAARALPEMVVSREAPLLVSDQYAYYSGRAIPLGPVSSAGGGNALEGKVSGVTQGKGTLEVRYIARSPFLVSSGGRAYGAQAPGSKKVDYELQISSPQIDCDTALVTIEEPFTGVSGFSVSSLGAEKVSQPKSLESGGATRLSFTFSPLKKGETAEFAVSYIISDPQSAVASALAAAQQQADAYNRTKDRLSLGQAKLLISQNRTEDALTVLSNLLQDGQNLILQYADREQFLGEKSDAEQELSAAQVAVQQMADANADSAASQLSAIAAKLESSIRSASADAEQKGYSYGLQQLRKALADFRSSLASLSHQSATDAQEEYAKARKDAPESGKEALASAQSIIASAEKQYAKGAHLQSLLSSAKASRLLSSVSESAAAQGEQDRLEAEKVRAEFAALRTKADGLLAKYSAQYSALSSSSKKQLPLTPSEAQKRIEDAEKSMSASSKPSLTPKQSLLAANESLQQLQTAYGTLSSSLSSLQSYAENSLEVAKIALSEVKQKASDSDSNDVAQIEAEASKAEGFLANALYADSTVSSERTLKAANAFLAKKGTGGIDMKALLLGGASLLFLAAAAYYFISRAKKPQQKEKRALQKEE